jgi:cold shock CspA family protein/ribosome-associated translation inhibitor RaiA
MDVQIEGQRTEVEPTLQTWITHRLEELNGPYEDIFRARVTLLKNERHQKGSDEARVFLSLSGKTLSATRTADTIDDALYEVIDVISRELDEFRTIRRGAVKTPGPRPRGRIVRLFADRGYGFIETESHREVYFHANSVRDIPFDKLEIGMAVELDVEAGNKGPQASRVTPHYP